MSSVSPIADAPASEPALISSLEEIENNVTQGHSTVEVKNESEQQDIDMDKLFYTPEDSPFANCHTRVGEQYQAVIPDIRPKEELLKEPDIELKNARWLPSKVKNWKSVDAYLAYIEGLMCKDRRFCSEERFLYFLHRCNYDVPAANRGIKPAHAPAAPNPANEKEMWPADDFCRVCQDGGSVIVCDDCGFAYHPGCLKMDQNPPEDQKWLCPSHYCVECRVEVKQLQTRCTFCTNSYCQAHVPAGLIERQEAIHQAEFLCDECLKEEEAELEKKKKRLDAKQEAATVLAQILPPKSISNFTGKLTTYATKADHYNLLEKFQRIRFLNRLQAVLKRDSKQLIRQPIVAGTSLDLYKLYSEVVKRGGIRNVMNSKSSEEGWGGVRRVLNIPKTVPNPTNLLKMYYVNILYSYEKQYYSAFKPITFASATKEDKTAGFKDKDNKDKDQDDSALSDKPDDVLLSLRYVSGQALVLPPHVKEREKQRHKAKANRERQYHELLDEIKKAVDKKNKGISLDRTNSALANANRGRNTKRPNSLSTKQVNGRGGNNNAATSTTNSSSSSSSNNALANNSANRRKSSSSPAGRSGGKPRPATTSTAKARSRTNSVTDSKSRRSSPAGRRGGRKRGSRNDDDEDDDDDDDGNQDIPAEEDSKRRRKANAMEDLS